MAFKTALVVDDSKSARFALRRFLENQYYKVDTAESAEECHVALQRMRPDVIFLDHVMPGTDGMDVLRQLKSDPATADIKVVICSSNDAPEFMLQATSIGAAGVLVKPPSSEQLTHILYNLDKAPMVVPLSVPPPVSTPIPPAAPSVAAAPSKVANIREPDVAIEQRVMNRLRNTLSSAPTQPPPLPPPVQANALNEVAYSLTVQIAQLQAQAAQLQTRIDDEQLVAQTKADLRQLEQEVTLQDQRITALEQLVDQQFADMHAMLEAGLRAQAERLDEAVLAAGERAREETERTVMNAATRISDQLANSILSALRNVAINPLAPHNPAEPSLSGITDRRQA